MPSSAGSRLPRTRFGGDQKEDGLADGLMLVDRVRDGRQNAHGDVGDSIAQKGLFCGKERVAGMHGPIDAPVAARRDVDGVPPLDPTLDPVVPSRSCLAVPSPTPGQGARPATGGQADGIW